MNMPARAPVMPLAQTREEINATAAALRHLAAIWGECFHLFSSINVLLNASV